MFFQINLTSLMLAYVFYNETTCEIMSQNAQNSNSVWLPPNIDLLVKIATPIGTLIGQVVFGLMADAFGRKRMCRFHFQLVIYDSMILIQNRWCRTNYHSSSNLCPSYIGTI